MIPLIRPRHVAVRPRRRPLRRAKARRRAPRRHPNPPRPPRRPAASAPAGRRFWCASRHAAAATRALGARLAHASRAARSVSRDFMTPESQHGPVRALQALGLLTIALAVTSDARLPVVRVRRWELGARGAAVPEATVDEDGYAGADEDEVRARVLGATLPTPTTQADRPQLTRQRPLQVSVGSSCTAWDSVSSLGLSSIRVHRGRARARPTSRSER